MRFKLVAFDLDGTLAECDADNSWQLIREAFGVPNLWEKYKAGYISREEAMKGEYEHWRQKRVMKKKLDKLFKERYSLIRGAKKAVDELKKKGYKVVIISDGPKIAVSMMARKLGVKDYACNEIIFDKDGYGVDTKPTHSEGDKRISKTLALEDFAKKHRVPLEKCVAVGNDMDDANMFRMAGMSIAVSPKDDLSMMAHHIIETSDLPGIVDILKNS